jgi:hypothetical protein
MLDVIGKIKAMVRVRVRVRHIKPNINPGT